MNRDVAMGQTMSPKALNRALLARQMLLTGDDVPVLTAVERLVGLQAQQPMPPFVALWTRLAKFDRGDLLTLLKNRQIVRATTMRGTLHLMSARDYTAFRQTFQPMLTAGMNSVLRDRAKGLDVSALVAIARRFFGSEPRTFTELRGELLAAFPKGDERAMGYAVRMHLPITAAPDGSPWGFEADPGFIDAETWLERPIESVERREDLVLRYLAAFGPATAADAQGWLGVGGLKDVLETLRPQLATFRDEKKRELFDLADAPRPAEDTRAPVCFLPGFDSAILAHVDRSRIIADEHRGLVTTRNLQVLPTILVHGFVAGTWKNTCTKKTATLTISPFTRLPATVRKQLTTEGERLLRFIEPEAAEATVRFEAT
jgi:DNA glycosylase AlkZ-like